MKNYQIAAALYGVVKRNGEVRRVFPVKDGARGDKPLEGYSKLCSAGGAEFIVKWGGCSKEHRIAALNEAGQFLTRLLLSEELPICKWADKVWKETAPLQVEG